MNKPIANRRGTVTIALLIALVLLQLVIVGLVNGGARDHDLTVRRAETVRAFYAAEAGMNMAVREMMIGTDADGDGGIGTISADGNSANDPSIGGSLVTVTSSTSGGATTLTSAGRSGIGRRNLQALLQ